jgi:hypothetical protein
MWTQLSAKSLVNGQPAPSHRKEHHLDRGQQVEGESERFHGCHSRGTDGVRHLAVFLVRLSLTEIRPLRRHMQGRSGVCRGDLGVWLGSSVLAVAIGLCLMGLLGDSDGFNRCFPGVSPWIHTCIGALPGVRRRHIMQVLWPFLQRSKTGRKVLDFG